MKKNELWDKINAYHFDNLVPAHLSEKIVGMFGGTNPSTHAFAVKLAKKYGWTVDFALRAIMEYKKYVFLGVTSGHHVTPSLVIDEVWHTHMLFTKGYREFCAEVLGQDFDHAPELVSSEGETEVFNAQYEETLGRYVTEFNVEPPTAIWGVRKNDSIKPKNTHLLRKKKRRPGSSGTTVIVDDSSSMPLYMLYAADSNSHLYASHPSGFGGGTGWSGGGGGTTFDDQPGQSSQGDGGSTTFASSNGTGDGGTVSLASSPAPSCGGSTSFAAPAPSCGGSTTSSCGGSSGGSSCGGGGSSCGGGGGGE